MPGLRRAAAGVKQTGDDGEGARLQGKHVVKAEGEGREGLGETHIALGRGVQVLRTWQGFLELFSHVTDQLLFTDPVAFPGEPSQHKDLVGM